MSAGRREPTALVDLHLPVTAFSHEAVDTIYLTDLRLAAEATTNFLGTKGRHNGLGHKLRA